MTHQEILLNVGNFANSQAAEAQNADWRRVGGTLTDADLAQSLQNIAEDATKLRDLCDTYITQLLG